MIERADVERVLQDIAREMPDRLNPWTTRPDDDGVDTQVCQYTDPEDHTKHCIAGEALVRLGLPCPGPDDGRSIYAVVSQNNLPMNRLGLQLLETAQAMADEVHDGLVNPQPWGYVVEKVLR